MHRMRHFVLLTGLTLTFAAVADRPALAGLIRPSAARAYPDIAGDINGRYSHTYDAETGTGTFEMSNTPYLLAIGPDPDDEFAILPDPHGERKQTLTIRLDAHGQVVSDPGNLFELHGAIAIDGQQFEGLLLQGTPIAFGAQDLGELGIDGTDIFDVNLEITGGLLATAFGPDAYMRIMPELNSTFEGSFTTDFAGAKVTSNIRGYNAPHPIPIPEPTTLLIVVAGGGLGLACRRKLRRP